MIQTIGPAVFHNEFDPSPAPLSEADVVLAYNGRNILCRVSEEGEIRFAPVSSYPQGALDDAQYLFRIDGTRYFLYRKDMSAYTPKEDEMLPGYRFESMNVLRTAFPKISCFAGMTGYHLYVWYRDNAYCGRCGAKMRHSLKERAMQCDACGNISYPRICPAVIVGVTDGDRIVMTQYAGRRTTGYSLVAGFCEIGETAEETVAREVMEEVGLRVKNVRYYKSQPWGFESDLLTGFYCDVDGDREIRMDPGELKTARWFSRDEIDQKDNDVSMTSEMIWYFKTHPEAFGASADH